MDSNNNGGPRTVTLDVAGAPVEISLDGLTCTATTVRGGVVTLALDQAPGQER